MKVTSICLLLLLVSGISYSQTIKIDSFSELRDSSSFYFFEDTAKSKTLQQVLEAFKKNQFKRANHLLIKKKYPVYWLHFYLTNHTEYDEQWVLDFQNWSLVDAYVKDSSQFQLHKTGHLLPFRKRDFPVANKAYILVLLMKGSTTEVFVRLESKYNNELMPEMLTVAVAPRHMIDKKSSDKGKVIYSFLAVFLISFIYHSFVYLSTRIRSYAIYLAVIFFVFYHTAYNSGYIVELFGSIDAFPVYLTAFETLSSTLLGISILLFVLEFLKVKERYLFWNRIIYFILISYIVFGILLLINEEAGTVATSLSGMAMIVVIVTLCIKSIRDRYPGAVYFFIGCTAFLVSILIIILNYLKALPKDEWTFSIGLGVGGTIQIIFFSFSLANMINVLQRENQENQLKQQRYLQEKEDREVNFRQELLKSQLEIQEQTFHNISEEIHDNIGQTLMVLNMNLHAITKGLPGPEQERATELLNLLGNVIQSLRDLSKTLDTEFINERGLNDSIERQLNLLNKTGLYSTELTVNGEASSLDAERELVIFRIVQELLNNIVKHANATAISIEIQYSESKVMIVVKDNGSGFIPDDLPSDKRTGLGLRNIRNRVNLINGIISFNKQPENGTAVTLEILK